MLTLRLLALVLAFVCFLIAAKPPADITVRCEWLAAAFVVLAWLL